MAAKPSSKTKALEVEVMPALPEIVGSGKTALRTAGEVETINQLHQKANTLADEAKAKASEAGYLAVLTGVRLLRLKAMMPHGTWGKLFSGRKNPNSAQTGICAEFEFAFSQDTAGRYMALAEGVKEAHALTGPKETKLIGLAEAHRFDDKDRKFLDKITEGASLSDLYDTYGVKPKTPAAKKGGPGGARPAKEESVEEIQKREQALAHKDADDLIEMIDAFIATKRPGLLDKDYHRRVTDAVGNAHKTLRDIKH